MAKIVGRGRANLDIGISTEVFRALPYAIAVECKPARNYCLTCNNTRDPTDYLTCDSCKAVSFCNERCRSSNLTHRFECETGFQYIKDVGIKCTIQMVLEALANFDSFEDLQNDIEELLSERHLRRNNPTSVNNRIEKLYCILRLQMKDISSRACLSIDKIYRYLISMPEVLSKIKKMAV